MIKPAIISDTTIALKLTLFFGIFSLMALSNAIIPVLPDIDDALHIQAFIFSSYFFGAMLITLPGGIISDRYGQIPVLTCGLFLTLLSGCVLSVVLDARIILLARIIEGFGAGLFVAAGLSWINYQRNHARLSGIFMALMNFGLLAGLIGGGWIAGVLYNNSGGIAFFTVLSVIPLTSIVWFFVIRKDTVNTPLKGDSANQPASWRELCTDVGRMAVRQSPLWYSVIILLGITGFVQAIYPEISGLSSTDIGITLAIMNLATIIASLTAPWFRIEPVLLIRVSAICMAVLVLIFTQFPYSVFIMGFAAGLIMISQIRYLAIAEQHQGIAMGLFSTSSYAGMTIIPAIGGSIAGLNSVMAAAILISALALLCAVSIGRCKCRGFLPDAPDSI